MFKVKELEKAPKWDGHTPQVAIDRLSKLSADVVEVRHGYWLSAYEYSLMFDISEERRNEVKKDSIWKFCNLCEQSAKWRHRECPVSS